MKYRATVQALIVLLGIAITSCAHTFDPPSTFESDSVEIGMVWTLVQDPQNDAFNLGIEVYDATPARRLDSIARSFMVVNGDTLIIDREIQLSRWSIWIPREEEHVTMQVVTTRDTLSYSMPYPADNGVDVPRTISRSTGVRLALEPPLGTGDSVFIAVNAAVGQTRKDIRTYAYAANGSAAFVLSGEEVSRIASEGTNLRCDVMRTSRREPQQVFPAGLDIRTRFRLESTTWTVTP